MRFQEEIIERFKLNPTHAKACERCFGTTSSRQFWVWDPIDGAEEPYSEADAPTVHFTHLLHLPTARQRRESLEIQCGSAVERTLIALDKCLVTEGPKCDGMLFFKKGASWSLFWVELKMDMKTQNPKPKTLEDRLLGEKEQEKKGAFNQILAARSTFLAKGIELASFKQRGFVAIPEDLMELAQKSDEIQRIRVALRKTLTITIGSKLMLE